MLKKKLFLYILNLFNFIYSQNKIVYLISPPRSSSVAFLRMMQARKDFTIMHEPSQFVFNLKFSHIDVTKKWFKENAPQTFEEVKSRIFTYAKNSNVFVKEISFAVKDFFAKRY